MVTSLNLPFGFGTGEPVSFDSYHYSVVQPLKAGAMAQTFLGRGTVSGGQGPVVIKRLAPDLARDPRTAERWLAACERAAALQHDGALRVLHYGLDDAGPTVVLEYVDSGVTLADLLRQARQRGAGLDPRLSTSVALGVLEVLCAAHRQAPPLVHLDLSPRNILLARDGSWKVAEFGLWAALEPSAAARLRFDRGRVQYLSPEQVGAARPDARSDLFSLGAILFEMLCSERAFAGATQLTVAMAMSQGRRVPWGSHCVDDNLKAVVDHLLGHSPDERFQTAEAAHNALSTLPVHAGPADALSAMVASLHSRADGSDGPSATGQSAPGAGGRPLPNRSGATQFLGAHAPAERPAALAPWVEPASGALAPAPRREGAVRDGKTVGVAASLTDAALSPPAPSPAGGTPEPPAAVQAPAPLLAPGLAVESVATGPAPTPPPMLQVPQADAITTPRLGDLSREEKTAQLDALQSSGAQEPVPPPLLGGMPSASPGPSAAASPSPTPLAATGPVPVAPGDRSAGVTAVPAARPSGILPEAAAPVTPWQQSPSPALGAPPAWPSDAGAESPLLAPRAPGLQADAGQGAVPFVDALPALAPPSAPSSLPAVAPEPAPPSSPPPIVGAPGAFAGASKVPLEPSMAALPTGVGHAALSADPASPAGLPTDLPKGRWKEPSRTVFQNKQAPLAEPKPARTGASPVVLLGLATMLGFLVVAGAVLAYRTLW